MDEARELSQSRMLMGPRVPPGRFPNYMLVHRRGWVRILVVNTLTVYAVGQASEPQLSLL